MDLREIGERVKRLREERGWSQKELARRAKCSQQHVSYVERAATNVTWSKLGAILSALDQRLWVHVQDTKTELMTVEVSKTTAHVIETFETLTPRDRDIALRFVRGLPIPQSFEGMVQKLLEYLETESRRRLTHEERRTTRQPRGKTKKPA